MPIFLVHSTQFFEIFKKHLLNFSSTQFTYYFRGGLFAGYCGPPHVEGVCCVFSSPNCDKRVTQKISYFTNKNFPRNDLEPFQCQLSIKPLKNMCWIRFDFETFELSADGSGGSCIYESIGILNRYVA